MGAIAIIIGGIDVIAARTLRARATCSRPAPVKRGLITCCVITIARPSSIRRRRVNDSRLLVLLGFFALAALVTKSLQCRTLRRQGRFLFLVLQPCQLRRLRTSPLALRAPRRVVLQNLPLQRRLLRLGLALAPLVRVPHRDKACTRSGKFLLLTGTVDVACSVVHKLHPVAVLRVDNLPARGGFAQKGDSASLPLGEGGGDGCAVGEVLRRLDGLARLDLLQCDLAPRRVR
jgi:hypothetical protein